MFSIILQSLNTGVPQGTTLDPYLSTTSQITPQWNAMSFADYTSFQDLLLNIYLKQTNYSLQRLDLLTDPPNKSYNYSDVVEHLYHFLEYIIPSINSNSIHGRSDYQVFSLTVTYLNLIRYS